jgi:hypothetical protein
VISLDQVVCKDKKTASRIIAGEAIVLTPMNSKIYNLNETGSRIWTWLDGKPTVGELAEQMQREFKVSEEQAQADVIAFLEELAARGMVTLGEGSKVE